MSRRWCAGSIPKGLADAGALYRHCQKNRLIQPIGEWVLWAACRQLADFRDAGLDSLRMAINISAIQMRNGNLPMLVRGIMEAFELKAET